MKARIKAAATASIVASLSLAPQNAEALYVSGGWGPDTSDYVDPMDSMSTFKQIQKDVRGKVRSNKKNICDVPNDFESASLEELFAQKDCLDDLSRWKPSPAALKKRMRAEAKQRNYCHVRNDNFWKLVEDRDLPLSESAIFEWEYADETDIEDECTLNKDDLLPSYERNSLDWQLVNTIVAKQDQCIDDFVFETLPNLVVNFVSDAGDEIKASQ